MTRELRFVTFRVGSETFLADIMAVRQILPYAGSTHVPTAPPFVEGVIVVRNEVVPIIDLASRLYAAPPKTADQPLVLLAHTPAGMVGLKVDEVRRMLTLQSDELLPAPATIRGIRGEFLVGIARHDDELFLLLDVDAVLTAEEQQQLQGATLTSGA